MCQPSANTENFRRTREKPLVPRVSRCCRKATFTIWPPNGYSSRLILRIPIFYTLTKIHKPIPVGRPIISGCDGPKEQISAFVDRLIQPIAKQDSYLKDTTDFLNFIESTKLPKNIVLVSVDVTSLYTNIPHEEGVTTICHAYEDFHRHTAPIPTKYLREMLYLILTEN